jgi:hypothetical protein
MKRTATEREEIASKIRDLFSRFNNALIAVDLEILQRLIGDDYVHFHSSGRIDSKKSLIERVKSGPIKHVKKEMSDLRVRVYASTTAILTGRGRNAIVLNNEPKVVDNLFTTVWVRSSADADDWQMVSWGAGPAPTSQLD